MPLSSYEDDRSIFQKYGPIVLDGLESLEKERSIYPHQAEAVRAIKGELENQPSGKGEFEKISLAVLPTGTGKTGVGILVAYACKAHRVLIITPSKEISLQWMTRFRPVHGKLNEFRNKPFFLCRDIPSEEDRSKPNVWAPMNGMCVLNKEDLQASLDNNSELVITNAHKFGEDGTRGFSIDKYKNDHFSLVIVDEAHHFPARTWKRIVDHFQGAKLGILFLTATPHNRGRYILSLKEVGIKKEPCYEFSIEKAINSGIIREITFDEGKCMYENEESVSVKRQKQIEETLRLVEKSLRRHDREDVGKFHKAMVLAADRKEAIEIKSLWNENIKFGTCKTYLQGDPWSNVVAFKNDMATPEECDTDDSMDTSEDDDTETSVEDAMEDDSTENDKITRVLVIILRLTEGFDYKQVSVAAILRNVQKESRVYFAQFVGRAVRKLHPDDPVTTTVISHEVHKQRPNYDAFIPVNLPDKDPKEPEDESHEK